MEGLRLPGSQTKVEGVAAEKLQKHRPQVLGNIRQPGGFIVIVGDGLGADHLRDGVGGAKLGAQPPVGGVGNASHRGQGRPACYLNVANTHDAIS